MEWVFDGGRPSLDLVNTLRNRHAEGFELLTGPAALAEWLELAGLTDGRVPVSEDQLKSVRWLREAVDRLLTAAPENTDVEVVNHAVEAPAPAARLELAGGELHRAVPPPSDPVAAALAALASDAVDLLTGPVAVRVCAAGDCGLRFADASPRRTRQWCSMARCGNRAKARAHYARTRGESPTAATGRPTDAHATRR